MPTGQSFTLAIGVLLLILAIYELATKKAYGVRKRHRAKELKSRWHTRSDDPRTYWKLVASHGIFGIGIIAYLISKLP